MPIPSDAFPQLGDDGIAFFTAGEPDLGIETDVGVFFRLSDTVVQLSLRGGADLNTDGAIQAARAAAGQLYGQCGSHP